MPIQALVLRFILLVQFVSALRVLSQEKSGETRRDSALLKIMDALSKSSSAYEDRRTNGNDKIYDLKTLKEGRLKNSLRQKNPVMNKAEELSVASQIHAQVNEQELEKIARSGRSELLLRPYIQKKGRNDYLVIQTDSLDPFVTIVPNSIYYDIEKKCVNWLDACSLKGIRNHLLTKVLSPYK